MDIIGLIDLKWNPTFSGKDPQKHADLWIRIKGGKYQPKTS